MKTRTWALALAAISALVLAIGSCAPQPPATQQAGAAKPSAAAQPLPVDQRLPVVQPSPVRQQSAAALSTARDVLGEYNNVAVTALTEDCESVRMALGAAWDDALACRAFSGYLRAWTAGDHRQDAEDMVKRGTKVFEKLFAIDHGIMGVRLGRDTRDEPQLMTEAAFWRNELALAARDVCQYAAAAAALRADLARELAAQAARRGLSSRQIDGMPWSNADREAWRRMGPMTGVRLPLEPEPNSPAAWWAKNLSLAPGYMVTKQLQAGEVFFSPERLLGAWGCNCSGPGQYDWSALNRNIAMVRDRGGKFLLELPTLHKTASPAEMVQKQEPWIWTIYAPPLPKYLEQSPTAALLERDPNGVPRPYGGVQLFDPATAKAYGEYLKAMAADLKGQGLYDSVIAVHLERGDSAELPEEVDYSDYTKTRWQAFMKEQYKDIGALNRQAGMAYKSFEELPLPVRTVDANAAKDWEDFRQAHFQHWLSGRYKTIQEYNAAWGANYKDWKDVLLPADAAEWEEYSKTLKSAGQAWGGFLYTRYRPKDPNMVDAELQKRIADLAAAKSTDPNVQHLIQELLYRMGSMSNDATAAAIQAALGDTYQDGFASRVPLSYPPVISIDYLHFRRAWVKDYLAVKRGLVAAAFPDKLLIAEMRQMGDHDGIAGASEKKWGGFLGDDFGQMTGVGPANENMPFMVRSVGPPGFGTRVSDSIESLYRDYLWLNFRDPGNLMRYFYAWVAHGYMDLQLGWHGITNHWLTNQLVYALGATTANTAPQGQRIGLVLPRSTFDLHEGNIYYEYLGWDYLLHAAKLSYTRVDEHVIAAGKLPHLGLDVLILPGATALDANVAGEIKTWVSNGGTLIASTIPATTDTYGRRQNDPLSAVLGASQDGTVCEAVRDTPLTVTISRGCFTGQFGTAPTRHPAFEALKPASPAVKVLASYEGGKPAITLNAFGKGRAVTIGYPFGREAVEADRTSIGFYRTYTGWVREAQLVARTAWLRGFIVDTLGYKPLFGVDYADVQRFKGRDAYVLGLNLPKSLSRDPNDWWYTRTVGDPRGADHEAGLDHEVPDMAIRFYPRHRDGLDTRYVGISTREVHYIAPRGDVNMLLEYRSYHCRINDPNIQAIWDVGRDVPVGFEPDAGGVSFNVILPSGYLMMLAVSDTPRVDLFRQGAFPGRTKEQVVARCKELAGGAAPPEVVILRPEELRPWLAELAQPLPADPKKTKADANAAAPAPAVRTKVRQGGMKELVLISYGDPANKPAAEKLAAFLRTKFNLDANTIEQAAVLLQVDKLRDTPHSFDDPVIYIGNDWTNNDMAIEGSYWGLGSYYGGHLPFTATYVWPGSGRAVIGLSRRYALCTPAGQQVEGGMWNSEHLLRPIQRDWTVIRQKLYIAADADDASRAVDALIESLK